MIRLFNLIKTIYYKASIQVKYGKPQIIGDKIYPKEFNLDKIKNDAIISMESMKDIPENNYDPYHDEDYD